MLKLEKKQSITSPISTDSRKKHSKNKGFSILELMIGMAILGIIVSIAYPSYVKSVEEMKITTAISDIIVIEQKISTYEVAEGGQPAGLAAIGMDGLEDPWGNPYQYLSFDANPLIEFKRKDFALQPINTDFDLYSLGKDGASATPLTSTLSADDVVRANNGSFRGRAEEY